MYRIISTSVEEHFTDEDGNFAGERTSVDKTVAWRWDGPRDTAPVYRPAYGPAYSITRIRATEYGVADGDPMVTVEVRGWPHTVKGAIDQRVASPDHVSIVDPAFVAEIAAQVEYNSVIRPSAVEWQMHRYIENVKATADEYLRG